MNADDIDQLVHDLLDEAHELILSMALTRRPDERLPDLVARLRSCADRAEKAAKERAAQHLRDAIIKLSKPTGR